MPDDYEKIRRRHPNIEQDPLPFDLDEARTHPERGRERPKRTKSIRTAACPLCCGPNHGNTKIGVIRGPRNTEVFREHDKITVGGRRIPCLGSGTEAPPRTQETT